MSKKRPVVSLAKVLAAIGLCLAVIGFPESARAAGEPFEYYHDFRGRPLPAELTFFNAEEGKFFNLEPEGLRITIPKGWIHPWGGVGFRTAFGFAGDFEVTLTMELLEAESPLAGYGVGVCLYVAKPGTTGGATIARVVRAGDNQVVLWDLADTPEDANPHHEEGVSPSAEKVGRLRLKRTGTTLHYLWAPGIDGDAFEEIHQCEFGKDQIDRIRLAALTGRQPCGVDVRLLDFRVRSGSAAAATNPATRWTLWLVTGLALAVCLGIWFAVRRRQLRPTSTILASGGRESPE
jgi:hypothetical protein